jgi:hypothetical protein
MHILIAFAVLVGLVAFAFGGDVARNVVRTCLLFVVMASLAGLTYVAVDVWRELHPPAEVAAKIPEDTPELRRACMQWAGAPGDAPRMCFTVLERMERRP